MNKMVINHLEKLLVTNDAATILRELEVSSDDMNLCSQETQGASQNSDSSLNLGAFRLHPMT